jgi:hypothetical protein
VAAGLAPHGTIQLRGSNGHIGTQCERMRSLMRVTGTDDDADTGHVSPQARNGCEAHGSGTEHCDHRGLDVGDDRSGEQRGVDAAGERFDEHGALVGHRVADAVEL